MTRLAIGCICIIVSLFFAGQSYAEVDSDAVLGVWLLDEGTGDVTEDASGNGNDGTLISAPEWVAGHFGNALEFNGSSSYVNCGNAETLNTEVFSVSFWCNIPSTQGWNHIVSKGEHHGGGNPGAVNWGVMMYDGQETSFMKRTMTPLSRVLVSILLSVNGIMSWLPMTEQKCSSSMTAN
ncbi:MAG: hypothetical protein P8Z79_16710 [Sedimentisphaerales bacterium]